MTTHHRWTDKQKAWVLAYYPKYGYKNTPWRFNKRFGLNLSAGALWRMASRLGAQHTGHDSMFTLMEICQMLPIDQPNLRRRIRNGTVKAQKTLGRYLVTHAEFERLKQFYAGQAPWPAIRSAEACKRLGYSAANLASRIQVGAITAVKCGREWWIKLDEIERAERYLRATGNSRVPWEKLKIEAERMAA